MHDDLLKRFEVSSLVLKHQRKACSESLGTFMMRLKEKRSACSEMRLTPISLGSQAGKECIVQFSSEHTLFILYHVDIVHVFAPEWRSGSFQENLFNASSQNLSLLALLTWRSGHSWR